MAETSNTDSKTADDGKVETVTVMVPETRERSVITRLYLVEIAKGLGITIRHFLRNIFNRKRMPIIEYPEKKRYIPIGFRGLHKLLLKEAPDPREGEVKCVACFMCATACPANAITIEAGEHEDPSVEKYPAKYEIDELRCIYCGYCVEACPLDAITMTDYYETCEEKRQDFIYDIDKLTRPPGGEK
ncbi:MAG: NADH-quinone oxidoreductase subunit I [Planctomycetota bacterium]|nr:MAG: NADH-quinone oxidoreductase subunit I [Planctomycetota bacterium]